MRRARIMFLMLLTLAVSPLLAQQEVETARRADIENLIKYNFAADDIIKFLSEKDRRLEIDEADVKALIDQKADPKLTDWLTAQLPKTAPKTLDVEGVIALWTKDKNEREVLAAVKAADREWLLSARDVLALVRADVPRNVVELMRGRSKIEEKKKESAEKIELDDVLKLTADGVPTAEIVAKIQASPTRFDVNAQRILELKRDGVAMEVLQALYHKRIDQVTVVDPEDEELAVEVTPKTPTEIKINLFRDPGTGFSMLQPEGWVTNKDYISTKSLIQMVDPTGAEMKGLPDLEMSVMSVHPKRKNEIGPSPSQLEAIALNFVESLTGQFARDGIAMDTQKPKSTWIANHPALYIETQSRVKATNASYRGGCYLLFAQDRIWVLTFSCRLEQSHRWLQVLDGCLRSFSLDDRSELKLAENLEDPREQVKELFDLWRRTIRRFDFDSYRKLHDGMSDDVNARRAFLSLASSVNDEGKRLELDGIDFESHRISYNVWGMDGQSRSSLGFLRLGSRYRLISGQP